jgi:hypothetical protein
VFFFQQRDDALLAVSILLYVLLDGFDLGVGILFGLTGSETRRSAMLAAVAPNWDGNETWLVVTAVILRAPFQSLNIRQSLTIEGRDPTSASSPHPKIAAARRLRSEMALDVEGVVDCCMKGEKFLR